MGPLTRGNERRERAVRPTFPARYDGHAEWYDDWAQTSAGPFMAAAREALAELLPTGPGVALDVGCGSGLHATVARDRGWWVLGVDHSADQRGDVAYSMLTHTDLDDFAALVNEGVRVLAPGGVFVSVGVHPCFNNPYAERLPDGVRLHPGYREAGWSPWTPYTGDGVRRRVGVHHLPLGDLLSAAASRRADRTGPRARPGRDARPARRTAAPIRPPLSPSCVEMLSLVLRSAGR